MECGNPLYLHWIEEWMEHAREHNNQSYFIYRKAYESMAKYPTRFTHPAEALCLAGIGEKTVAKLELKLMQYCKDNNLPMPTIPKRRKAVGHVQMEEEEGPKPKKARTPKVHKPYVPTYRSGAYAILLALLDAKATDGEGALTRHEITLKGQIYCDVSLTNPEHGKFYTGWSSMSTLLSKNLVYKSSTMYYLTDEGTDIAERMRLITSETGSNTTSASDAPELPTVASSSTSRQGAVDPPKDRTVKTNARSTTSASSSTHTSHHDGYEDTFRDNADAHDTYDLYRSWKDPRCHALTSSASTSKSISSAVPSLPALRALNLQGSNKEQPVNILSDSEDENDEVLSSNSRSMTSTHLSRASAVLLESTAVLSTKGSTGEAPKAVSSGLQRAPSLFKIPTQSAASVPASRSRTSSSLESSSISTASTIPHTNSSSGLKGLRIGDSEISTHDPFPHLRTNSFSLPRARSAGSTALDIERLVRFKPITFHPGSFEICLILDIREVRSQTDRDYIGDKLKERGISVTTRVLDIGDVIWIARLKDPIFNGVTELVLDYVVERKRMDDFVASIKDGRFNEQKFRLKRSGLANIIYLVETYKVGETYDIGAEAIRAAIMATQVQDGFFVRRTNNTDQTIDYFVSITNALKRLYESETLYAIPDENIDRLSYLDLQDHLKAHMPDRTFLTSYKSFTILNGKSETLMVKDTFVKMLMTIRGISPEKAMEIARVYGTPRALFSALDEAGDKASQSQRRMVLARSGSNVGKKKIGPALSAKVADIWYTDLYS